MSPLRPVEIVRNQADPFVESSDHTLAFCFIRARKRHQRVHGALDFLTLHN